MNGFAGARGLHLRDTRLKKKKIFIALGNLELMSIPTENSMSQLKFVHIILS